MRISDWSSDVCSSDLPRARDADHPPAPPPSALRARLMTTRLAQPAPRRRLLSFGPHRWLPRPGGLVGRTGPRPKHYRPPACSTVRNRLRSEPHIWRPTLHGRKGRHWVVSIVSPYNRKGVVEGIGSVRL